jgi:hypothetical protein
LTCCTGRAIFLIGDLARIYEGSQDHPFGPTANQAPSLPAPPEGPGRSAVTFQASELKAVRVTLDIAADYQRGRALMCTGWPDQSRRTCQARLDDAQAYSQIADRLLQVAEVTPAAHHGHAEPPGPPRQAGLAADEEAGQ